MKKILLTLGAIIVIAGCRKILPEKNKNSAILEVQNEKGEYVEGTIYQTGDLVWFEGNLYQCILITDTVPGTSGSWILLVDNYDENDDRIGNTEFLIKSISSFTQKVNVGTNQKVNLKLNNPTSTAKWTLISKPTDSNVSIHPADISFNFTPDKTGIYEFEVEVKNDDIVENRMVVVEANRAIALINGVNYPGNDIKCEVDLRKIRKILEPNNFIINEFRSAQVLKKNIFNELDRMANLLEAGDIFVFYFSGHGNKIPESITSTYGFPIDEEDGVDETLYMYDKENLVDDELDFHWRKFREGVRIVTISDSCYSGTVYRSIQGSLNFNISFFIDFQTETVMKAELIHFSGCLDGELAYGNNISGGVFTSVLVESYKNGVYNSYLALYNDILSKLSDYQIPDYHEYNASDSFINSKPFSR